MTTTATEETAALQLFDNPVEQLKVGTTAEIEWVDILTVEVDPDNPRTEPDAELEAVIRLEGVKEAAWVTPAPDAETRTDGVKFRLLGGERRYWGAIKAGHTTFPVRVDRRQMTRGQRLVLAGILNAHRELPILDDARWLLEVQKETGWSELKIAETLGRKKSTVADRLAIAKAPECFMFWFTEGRVGASAATIIRKFANVPLRILELAARTAPNDLEWQTAHRAGRAVENKDVERVLDKIILDESLKEIPEYLVLLYQGETCKVAGTIYATDIAAFKDAAHAYQQEQQRAVTAAPTQETGSTKPATASKGAASPSKAKTPKADTPASNEFEPPTETRSAAERKQQEREKKERLEKEAEDKAWADIRPALRQAIANEIKKASVDAKSGIQRFILGLVTQAARLDTSAGLVPRGQSSDDFLRWITFGVVEADIADGYDREGLPRRLKDLGLSVDVAAMLADSTKSKANAAPAKSSDRSAGTPKRGGRPLTPPAPTSRPKKAKAVAKKKSGKPAKRK